MQKLTQKALLSLTFALPLPASAAHLYATPNGAGNTCTQTKPCSITEAQTKARTLNHTLTEDLLITLAPGKYRLRQPLNFTPEDSGANSHTIQWQGSPTEPTILDGAIQIPHWTLHDKTKNIWSAPVPKSTTALQIYVNGTRSIPARHAGCVSKIQCSYKPDGLTTTSFSLGPLVHPDQVIAAFGVRWRDFRCRIQSIHGDDITMAEPCWHNTVADSVKEGWSNASPKGKPFKGIDWFENAYEFLGEPGQFYLDRAASTLFYVPRPSEDLAHADVELPVANHLLLINGASNLTFENLAFTHTAYTYSDTEGYVPLQAGYLVTGTRTSLPDNGEGMVRIPAAVEAYNARNLTFASNTFHDLGAAAIALDRGTHDSTIAHSTFKDLSGGAVFIGDTVAQPATPTDRAGNNRVTRNTVDRIALDYRDNVAIMGGFNDGLTIDHNTIANVPYTAISAGWGWNYEGESDTQRDIHIHANRISNFMLVLHDGGAIYTQAQSPGSFVTENYIDYNHHDNGNGIYLDERSRKYEVCGNVAWNRAPKMQEGQWVSTWSSWSGNLNIHDNWSDDPHLQLHNPGPTKTFQNNHLGLKEIPAEAQAVIAASGAEGKGEPPTGCPR